MIRKEPKISNIFETGDTDTLLPRSWKSGSLKYDELKPLSEGGTAKLYSTLDLNLQRNVAYKTLHEDLRNSDIETKRFLREARVTANIQHPGTVPLYELGRDREGQLFFTMKKVEKIEEKNFTFLYPLSPLACIYLSTNFVDKCVIKTVLIYFKYF